MPEPFWEVTATFAHPDGNFEAEHTTDKFWKKEEAEAAVANTKSPGTVKEITRAEEHAQAADAPQHHRLHHRRLQPARHHPLARDADRRGPLHGRLHLLSADRQHRLPEVARHQGAGQAAGRGSTTSRPRSSCSTGRSLEATRGKKETTDHPPIYPTQAVNPKRLEARSRGPPPGLRAGRPPLPGDLLAADGHRVDPRQHRDREGARPTAESGRPTSCAARSCSTRASPRIYTYARSADTEIPKLEEGQELDLEGVEMEGKETPPPPADQPGQADRDDGGARPRHQGDARRHHPEALRPRLRLRQPAGALGDGDRDVEGLRELRAAHGDART